MRSLLQVMLCTVLCSVASGQSADVELVTSPDHPTRLKILIGGQPFAEYNFGSDLPKPFLSPVRAADGTILTRPLENPEDHPHHKGVWVAVDRVNDVDFWAEKGLIRNRGVDVLPGSHPVRLRARNSWLGKDEQPVVEEETTISFFRNRLVTYDIVFRAAHGDVTFGDTKEGLFGFRMVNALREKEGGKVVSAAGGEGTSECWGQPADWIDYSGTVDGRTFGVALFDHPGNLRPSRYHVRNYGLFSISPFGEKAYTRGKQPAAPVTITRGKTLRLRYALYIHDGDAKQGAVAETFARFVRVTSDSDDTSVRPR